MESDGFSSGGLTYSGGYGLGLGSSISIGIEASNASNLNELKGPFGEAGGGIGPVSGNVQLGQASKSTCGKTIIVAYGGIGFSTPQGYVGANETGVWQLW